LSDTKFSLKKIAQFLEGELEGDPNAEVINVSGIESTALNTITFSTDNKTFNVQNSLHIQNEGNIGRKERGQV